MGEGSNTTQWGGFLLFFLIFFLVLGKGFGGVAYGSEGCNRVSNCEVERRTIETAATTNFNILDQGNKTRMEVMADGEKTRAKIDFYEYQNLRDKITERDAVIAQLRSEAFASNKFNALEAQIAKLACDTPKRPPAYAQIGLPCASDWPTGCGAPALV